MVGIRPTLGQMVCLRASCTVLPRILTGPTARGNLIGGDPSNGYSAGPCFWSIADKVTSSGWRHGAVVPLISEWGFE